MKTNREKLLQDAFVMFLQYNYERASYSLLTQATGISKAGISYYYPTKQELFVAVVDRYIFDVHDADLKFTPASSLAEFIDHFIENVRRTMEWYIIILQQAENTGDSTAFSNFFGFMLQIQRYYPNAKVKLSAFWDKFLSRWNTAITEAIERGELRRDIDIEWAGKMFCNAYLGMSFMQSFSTGLDVEELRRSYNHLYDMLKTH
ncbi:TetR/AcrR family transcriptional regulator [uncultured Bacteroides sp.]|uniref:TetR/AcrR family transcriptional regulator n=1 Tax=uncultured Bacteroides sp. TaxID=162156 RepID=UPI0025E28628|nr:TetR/AcrR family transcriptional regulator [uncultured Bacteroides sp.]